MKYLTKEWYMMLQGLFVSDFTKIEEKTYSDREIRKLYRKALEKEIRRDKKDFNTPPILKILDESELNLNETYFLDENTNTFRNPIDYNEYVEISKHAYDEQLKEFINRGEYDEKETKSFFRCFYLAQIKNMKNHLPSWVLETMDIRLLALGYMYESILDRFKKEVKEREKTWKKINKDFGKAMKKEKVPEEIKKIFYLHDSYLLSIKKEGSNFSLFFNKDENNDLPYRKVIFKDYEILERDKGLNPKKEMTEEGYRSHISYLYEEIYKVKDFYEVHMMYFTFNGLKYLTIKAKDILYKDMLEI